MPCAAYVVANPLIIKCGNFSAFRVGGCIVQKVWPPCGASLAPLYHSYFSGLWLLYQCSGIYDQPSSSDYMVYCSIGLD